MEFNLDNFNASLESIKKETFTAPGTNRWAAVVYFDPRESKVYTFPYNQGSEPGDAFHGIDKYICSVPNKADSEDVAKQLAGQEKEFRQISAGFKGTTWNGNNWVGYWSFDDEWEYFSDVFGGIVFRAPMEPSDALSSDDAQQVYDWHKSGLTAEECCERAKDEWDFDWGEGFILEDDVQCWIDMVIKDPENYGVDIDD